MSEVKMIAAAALRVRYGISDMTIWRWLRDPEVPLPAPRVIRERRYWLVEELDEFDRKVATVKQRAGREPSQASAGRDAALAARARR